MDFLANLTPVWHSQPLNMLPLPTKRKGKEKNE
jgi:hypothetical protein